MSMQVWRGCDDVPAWLPPTSVTIGAFDGVHRGHRVLLDVAVREAGGSMMPVAITFDPHPMAVIRPDLAPPLLTGIQHRLELFAEAGVAGTLVLPFTPALAAESAEHFATRILAETLGARHVVVGRNFRFGHRAAGDVVTLAELGRELDFDVSVVDLEPLGGVARSEDDPQVSAVSSTAIRAMLADGDVARAQRALGRPHRLTGPVITGDRRGRSIGYPTANVEVAAAMAVPADGVYAGRFRTHADRATWRTAAISVGTNPTFDGDARRVEAYVLDAPEDFDVYDQIADVEFLERLRPMERFASVAELVEQMDDDVRRTRALVG
jgi:riboflavin kinase/FMN adenylyltransferase